MGAFFRTMKVNENWSSQASTLQEITIKYHKSVPYDPCAIFQVFDGFVRGTRENITH